MGDVRKANPEETPAPGPEPADARAPASPGRDTPVPPEPGDVRSSELSALLAEMFRTEKAPVEGWSPDLQPGGSIGRFRIVRELGRGGFGVVYEARDDELDRPVAVKVLRPGVRVAGQSRTWLEREARAVARLNHPHIVTLHDFGQSPAGPFLVFELLRGTSLAQRLEAGPLRLDEALGIAVDVARALVHAHESGVVHRDLKPANVHLDVDGTAKVLDFGLAHLFGQTAGTSGGTPAYMAPEQWGEGGGEPRSDLFALGVMLHQCLSGALPYRTEKGWSEVQEPGPTPVLPRRAGPPALRRMVACCLDRDPARRPPDARAARDALLAIRRAHAGRFRRRTLGALAAVTMAALAAAGWLLADREPPPGEQVRVVLAATDNAAGEPALAALDGLVRAALGPSRRVRLVAPARLDLVAREAGFPAGAPLDVERARSLARVAGAAVVLVPAARRDGADLAVEVRGIEAETGRELFVRREPLGRADDLAAAADRLADVVRTALDERREDRRLRRPVAEAVTSSAEAARLYYEGVDCLRTRPAIAQVELERCTAPFERALSLDPGLSLARYQLAAMRFYEGGVAGDGEADLDAALRDVGRLPTREARLVQALDARRRGDVETALTAYRAVLADDPDDVEALRGVGLVLFAQGAWADAAPYLEKLVALAPEQEDPAVQLVNALGSLGRADARRARVAEWRAEPVTKVRRKALVLALLWLGDPDGARAAAARGAPGEDAPDADAQMLAASGAGAYAEVERLARAEAERHPDEAWRSLLLARAVAAQGRLRDATRIIEEATRGAPVRPANLLGVDYWLAMLNAGAWDRARVWRHAARAVAVAPRDSNDLALVLLLLGDVAHATELARGLAPGSVADVEYRALVAWRAGRTAEALSTLFALEGRDPLPMDALPPSYLVAEVATTAGDPGAALAAIARFRRLPPRGLVHCWAYPRTLLLAARARFALGQPDEARREIEALLALQAKGDRDLPLLREARALRRSR